MLFLIATLGNAENPSFLDIIIIRECEITVSKRQMVEVEGCSHKFLPWLQFPALLTVHRAFTSGTWLAAWLLTVFSLLEIPPHTELMVYSERLLLQWCTFKQLFPTIFFANRRCTLSGALELLQLGYKHSKVRSSADNAMNLRLQP